MSKKILSLLTFICFSSPISAGYKIHSDSDLTISSPITVTDEAIISTPDILRQVTIDPSLPFNTLSITCGGTLKVNYVIIRSFGDLILQAQNNLDIIGIIKSGKRSKLEAISGKLDFDGGLEPEGGYEILAEGDINLGHRPAERLSREIVKVTIAGIKAGQFNGLPHTSGLSAQ